jgi:GT2 family glycosyltransferase/glycosyltransferase involved in cell wall biosynthesis
MTRHGPEARLDVVIVTHGSAAHLPRALAGLPPDARVIVVDNASTDGSVRIAVEAGAEVVRGAVNAGFAAGANRGARLGGAPAILFLNPDASIAPADLERLLAVLEREPDTAIVAPRIRLPDGREQRSRWPIPTPGHAWREALGLASWGGHRSGTFVIGACLLVRRAAFEALHGFDERFWLYGEEADLCRRALDAGWGVRSVEDAVADHVAGASGRGLEDVVFEHFNRGVEHLARKHHGGAGLLGVRSAQLVGSTLRSLAPGDPARRRYHRRRLRRLVRVLATSPLSVPLDSPATRAPGRGLVVCSLEAWDEVWRRNQFLVRELLALEPDRRVLFVEPPFDWLVAARTRRGQRHRGLRPVEEEGRVVRFQPGKVLPRLLGPFADRSLERQVRRAVGALGFVEPALWVNDPSWAGLARRSGWPVLYDMTDDWLRAGLTPRQHRRIAEAERWLFGHAHAVVVCSEELRRSRADARPDAVVIPNAVDAEHFRRPRPRPEDLPVPPCLVYVGTLHEDRLDLDLLEALAERLPEATLVLVGPNALAPASAERLRRHPNVALLGPRPYAEVPAYLQHAEVVVVPHVVSPFTESLDPIKAYECLAVGRPVVATPVAGFRGLGPPVHTAEPERFVAAVAGLLERPAPVMAGPVPSWAERARRFAAALPPVGPARAHTTVVGVGP